MVKNKREARRIGKLGKGKRKTYGDVGAAVEQRRLAGIRSGEARRAKLARIAADIQSLKARL